MIGSLYVNFVPVYIDSLHPIGLVLCACLHCTLCPHTTVYMHVAKNNTIFTTMPTYSYALR